MLTHLLMRHPTSHQRHHQAAAAQPAVCWQMGCCCLASRDCSVPPQLRAVCLASLAGYRTQRPALTVAGLVPKYDRSSSARKLCAGSQLARYWYAMEGLLHPSPACRFRLFSHSSPSPPGPFRLGVTPPGCGGPLSDLWPCNRITRMC